MKTVKVSSKGQIVIPKEILDAQRIAPGAELEIYTTADEIHLRIIARPVARTTVAAGRGMLATAKSAAAFSEAKVRRRMTARLKKRDAATKARG